MVTDMLLLIEIQMERFSKKNNTRPNLSHSRFAGGNINQGTKMSYAVVTCSINGHKLRNIEALFNKVKKYKIETVVNAMNDCSIASFYVYKIKKQDLQFLYGLILGAGYENTIIQWCSTTTYTAVQIQ